MYEGIEEYLINWARGKKSPPFKIHIFPTNRCNLTCKTCWLNNSNSKKSIDKKKELKEKDWLKLIREGAKLGAKEWDITGGGEPLVRETTVLSIMKEIKKWDMKGEIKTNGTLFNTENVEIMTRIKYDRVTISLDAPNAKINDYIRPPEGTFEKIIEGIKLLNFLKQKNRASKPELNLFCVLSKENIDYIVPMIEMAAKFKIRKVSFDPIRKVNSFCQDYVLAKVDYMKNRNQIRIALDIAKKAGVYTNIGNILALFDSDNNVDRKRNGKKNKESTYWDLFCYEPWYRLIINPYGQVGPCRNITCLDKINSNNFLSEIWFGEKFEDIRFKIREGNFLSPCSKCDSMLTTHSSFVKRKMLQKLRKIVIGK